MLNSSSRTAVKAAKGLSAALGCHPERSEGSARGAQRCFAALSMTARTAVKAAQVRSQEKSYLHTISLRNCAPLCRSISTGPARLSTLIWVRLAEGAEECP